MRKIKRREGESLESMMRRFKRAVNDEAILADMKKHEEYESKSQKRRRKKAEAQQKRVRAARMSAKYAIRYSYKNKNTGNDKMGQYARKEKETIGTERA